MNENVNENTEAAETTVVEPTDETTPVVYEKGSWQEALQKSSTLKDRAGKANKTAGVLLWKGAKTGIETWLPESSTDVSGEGLYTTVIEALGRNRKGDASKIKTVAVAARQHSLDLAAYPNLSKAYAAAVDLTKGAQARIEEDDAAEKAIAGIEPPKTTGSVEGAAALLLSKGVDGAVVAILDALGAKNEAAHRAFMRAVSTEIAARVQANKPKPAPKAPKAAPKGATASTKAAPKKAVAVKGKPKGKTAAKPAPVQAEQAPEGTAVEAPAAAPVKAKGRPVVRRPGR